MMTRRQQDILALQLHHQFFDDSDCRLHLDDSHNSAMQILATIPEFYDYEECGIPTDHASENDGSENDVSENLPSLENLLFIVKISV